MKKNYFLTFLIGFIISNVSAQFTKEDVKFWIGTGQDSSVLIVDFKDGTSDRSYAWGFIYNESNGLQFGDILTAVAAAEPNFTFSASGGFLNDVIFNSHSGLTGNPDWWSTWSGSDYASMRMNTGISETITNGGFYGLSYGFSNPTAEHPVVPIPAYGSLWFNKNQVEYWVGTGSDSAVLVIDFAVSQYGAPKSFAYGVKFNGTITGKQMLELVDQADQNLNVVAPNYLDDITYNNYSGLAGNPDYWSTFSGTNMSDWVSNAGISTVVSNGEWFGTTYGSWPTPRPLTPVPSNDPNAITLQDIVYWTGSGSDSAVIVVDFNDGQSVNSYAFGYNFNAPATGKEALLALENAMTDFTVNIGNYLNDITYKTHVGIGGTNSNYWSTWSGVNNGNWVMNSGINTTLANGDWFGVSFTDFEPALFPGTPVSAPSNLSIANLVSEKFQVYPNPFTDLLNIQGGAGNLEIIDLTGKIVYTSKHELNSVINLSFLENGMYLISVESNGIKQTKSLKK